MENQREDRLGEDEEEYRERHRWDSEEQSKDCDHEMEYSSTIGVVGGICRKCGYRTI